MKKTQNNKTKPKQQNKTKTKNKPEGKAKQGITKVKAHKVICSVPYHSFLKTEPEWQVFCVVLTWKEHSANKVQRKKKGFVLQIGGCSMAVHKALIEGTDGSRVLCRASNKCVNKRIKWILSNRACNTSWFGAVCILGKCTKHANCTKLIIMELENSG